MNETNQSYSRNGFDAESSFYGDGTPKHKTRDTWGKEDDFNGLHASKSTAKLFNEVLAEMDRQVAHRKKELSDLLKSRSATKKKSSSKIQFTPIRNKHLSEFLSPEIAQDLARDLAKMSNDSRILGSANGDTNGQRHEAELNSSAIYDVSNIHEELEVEDATVQFGSSVYDHIHLSMPSPFIDHSSSSISLYKSDDQSKFPERFDSSAKKADKSVLTVADLNLHSPLADQLRHADFQLSEQRSDSLAQVSPSVDDDEYATSMRRSQSQNHSRSFYGNQSAISDLEKSQMSIASSVYTLNQAEIETYKMKYNTILLKYNILKNDFEQISERFQKTLNENSASLLQLKNDKSRLEQEKLLLEEDLISNREELLFVRGQLQSKSARVTDLEAELLLSHKYAHNMQHEIQLYRASPIACNAPSSDEFTQTEDDTVQQLQDQLHLLNQQLQQEKSENQKCRRQIADHLQDRRQLMSQVEELETRCKDSDSVAFAIETKNASLETLIESLRHENLILSESVESLTAAASAAATANAVESLCTDCDIANVSLDSAHRLLLLLLADD
eukprot:gene12758-13976_t